MNEIRKQILEEAYRLISINGFDKTSTNQICTNINITKPSLYYYFKNKEEIVLELLEENEDSIFNIIDTNTSFETVEVYKDFLLNNTLKQVMMHLEDEMYLNFAKEIYILASRNSAINEQINFYYQKRYDNLLEIIKPGIKLKAFKSNDLKAIVDLIEIVLTGIDTAIVYGSKYDIESIWTLFLASIMEDEK